MPCDGNVPLGAANYFQDEQGVVWHVQTLTRQVLGIPCGSEYSFLSTPDGNALLGGGIKAYAGQCMLPWGPDIAGEMAAWGMTPFGS